MDYQSYVPNGTTFAELNYGDEELPDRNGKHGDGLCKGLVPDLEWIAGTEVEQCMNVESHEKNIQ